MSDDTSPSSSEDEANNPTTSSPNLPKRNVTKRNTYKCPADFVSFSHEPCSSTLTNNLKNNNCELWLIKAPASFIPERFNGAKVSLSGLQTLRPAADIDGEMGSAHQCLYSALGSARTTLELHLLTRERPSSDGVACGPAFSGLINVCESYGDGSASLHPRAIPKAPAPSIPPGLKQRFLPFGSKTPTLTCVPESELDGDATGPSSATLRPRVVKDYPAERGEDEEGRRKKKKKKKDKRIKAELEETEVEVKTEPEMTPEESDAAAAPPFQEEEVSEERRKMKKRRRDREREEEEEVVQEPVEVKEEEVRVKCEPVDLSYEAPEGSAKKKKKKKRKSRAEEN